MLKSQKLLVKDCLTAGGSRMELISWTETEECGEQRSVHQIDVDDRMVWRSSKPLGVDANNWATEILFTHFKNIY